MNDESRAELPTTYDIEELIEQITDENLHGEIDFGPPIGNEAW